MSVQVRVKQKSFFKKKIGIEEIIKLTNLSYGVSDESYRLLKNEIANHTLLYDEKRLARGIDISLDGFDIILLLSLPTTSSEIRTFYEIIEKICNKLKIYTYMREEEWVCVNDKEKFIKYDEEASIMGLEDIRGKIIQEEYRRFELFGVYHPISIGLKEIKEIGNHLDNLEKYFQRIQSFDVYYAVPRVYKVDEKLIGIYVVGANIPSVVPTEPYIVLNQIQGIEEWYVMFGEGKTVEYGNFINHVNMKQYYDANHIIVTLSDDDITMLLLEYFTKI